MLSNNYVASKSNKKPSIQTKPEKQKKQKFSAEHLNEKNKSFSKILILSL